MIVKRWKTTRDGFGEEQVPTAPRDGKYRLDGVQYRTFAGAPLPAGAVMVPTEDEQAAAVKAETLPENKAETVPANKSRGKKAQAE